MLSPSQILTYLDGVVKVEETELKPRVGFLYPVLSHNISVFINATQEHDSGQYMCTVNVVDEASSMGKNIGVINLTVLGKALLVHPQLPLSSAMVSLGIHVRVHSAAGHPVLPTARGAHGGSQRDAELQLQEGEALSHVPVAAHGTHPAGLLPPSTG